MGYGVMGTTSAYAREGTVEIVHWPSPVRFGTSVTPSGKVIPMQNPSIAGAREIEVFIL